jgi:voltage-gated potassium channel Kch
MVPLLTVSAWIYYSFVTLTTLGYGDIVPVSRVARMLAVGEAVTGQLYLTVLVARLVALQVGVSNGPKVGDAQMSKDT